MTGFLETDRLSRHFDALRAVDEVSLSFPKGEITGLIGPNGAGKSTFFNLLTGTLKPTFGSIHFDGQIITGSPPDQLFGRGLARTFQIPRPFPKMSVLENVMVAPLSQIGENIFGPFLQRGRVAAQEREIREKALEILNFTTLAPLANHPAGQISGGQRKLLELARVLMGDPKVILLDEPSAGVNPSLTRVLVDRIEELNRRGTTFVIIEHDMDLVMRHCHSIVALAEGRVVFKGDAKAAQADKTLLDAYLGSPV